MARYLDRANASIVDYYFIEGIVYSGAVPVRCSVYSTAGIFVRAARGLSWVPVARTVPATEMGEKTKTFTC